MNSILILSIFSALAISLILVPVLIRVAKQQQLFDQPNERKLHQTPTPALGGVAIFAAVAIVAGIVLPTEFVINNMVIIAGLTLIFLMGLWDDLQPLSAKIRMVVQLLVASICWQQGFAFTTLFGIFGIETLTSFTSYLLTVLFICTAINAYNLIDGINGLAGSLSLVSSTGFALLFSYLGMTNWMLFALALVGGIMGFLYFNFGQAKVFMGDSGSTFLGLVFALMFFKVLNINTLEVVSLPMIVISASLIFVPIFDLLRVFALRIWQGKSPFQPDQNHLHHYLLTMGKSHAAACFIILALAFIIIGSGYLLAHFYSLTTTLICLFNLGLISVAAIQLSLELTEVKQSEMQRHFLSTLY
ncbi:MAG: glycosyltransferase family 4 protein [Saprospiraceae bacterium]